jgi:formylglycine-generating enzyme required for sulfatase activity
MVKRSLMMLLLAWCGSAAGAEAVIQDCEQCPRMVPLAAGSYLMGDAGMFSQVPVHKATIGERFAMGETEVTRAQFRFFVSRSGYTGGSDDDGTADARLPITGVDWVAARAYARWLSRHTGQRYRLPSEEEWEYAARAGASTRYWWGDAQAAACGHEHFSALYYGLNDAPCAADGQGGLHPVASLRANPWGLYDMLGNADEWMGSCVPLSLGKRFDGPADGCYSFDAPRVVRRAGDSYLAIGRENVSPFKGSATTGFRVVRELK